MSEPELLWLRPSDARATLAKAAERLGLATPTYPNESSAIPLIDLDFYGTMVLTYEAGVLVSIEKRELA